MTTHFIILERIMQKTKKKKPRRENRKKKKKKKEKKNGFLELYGSSIEITHRQIKKFPPR
jgi:hypothetical protein